MIKTILLSIFYFVLSAVCLYLLGALAAAFMAFEWDLSVFDVSTWNPISRLLLFTLSFPVAFAAWLG